jgi:nitrate reductase gamma subunit
MSYIHQLLFGIGPYLCATVFVVGCVFRFRRDQYSWQASSSQILSHRKLGIGSNLFHIGMLALIGGHVMGLLVPVELGHAFGVTDADHQRMELVMGSTAGIATLIGLSMLLYRRILDLRVSRTGNMPDLAIAILLWIALVAGLATLPFSYETRDSGVYLVAAGRWAQGIVTFQAGAAGHLAPVPLVFKLHVVLGLSVLLLFPFTRLVHIGSAPIGYLLRANYQIVRRARRPRLA